MCHILLIYSTVHVDECAGTNLFPCARNLEALHILKKLTEIDCRSKCKTQEYRPSIYVKIFKIELEENVTDPHIS